MQESKQFGTIHIPVPETISTVTQYYGTLKNSPRLVHSKDLCEHYRAILNSRVNAHETEPLHLIIPSTLDVDLKQLAPRTPIVVHGRYYEQILTLTSTGIIRRRHTFLVTELFTAGDEEFQLWA
jgi:hypothetical protein